MKKKIIFIPAIVLGTLLFASCKKDYTCTCTTVVGGASTTESHGLSKENHSDAQKDCDNYQTQANNSFPGGTTCHL